MEGMDKSIVCQKCRQPFVFSVAEQKYFASKELRNDPKRCPNCRILRRLESEGKDSTKYSNTVNCEICNALTVIPFKPMGNRPVYCAACMHELKKQSQLGGDSHNAEKFE